MTEPCVKLSSYPTDPEIIHGHDIGDALDSLWANAFGTGLGGPDGPEPDKPSRRFARRPISQEEQSK